MRKFFASLLLLIFIPVFILAILTWNIRSTFLNKEFVKDELSKNNVYGFIHDEGLPALTSDLIEGETGEDLESNIFTSEELTNLVQDSVSAEFLQTEVENVIDSIYPYFLSQEEDFEIEVNLGEAKKSFEKSFQTLAKKQINNLPKCTSKQLEEVVKTGIREDLSCKPPGYDTEKIAKEINLPGLTKEAADEFPDKIILSSEGITTEPKNLKLFNGDEGRVETSPEFTESLAMLRGAISRFILFSNILIISLILILILIVVSRLGSLKSIAKWLGWTLLIPSSFLLFLTLTSNLLLLDYLPNSLPTAFPEEPGSKPASNFANQAETFFIGNGETTGFIFQVINDFNQQILIQMAVVFAIALILIIIGTLLKSKQKQPEQPAQT